MFQKWYGLVDDFLQEKFGEDYQEKTRTTIAAFYFDEVTQSWDILKIALTALAVLIPLALCITRWRRPTFTRAGKGKHGGKHGKEKKKHRETPSSTKSSENEDQVPERQSPKTKSGGKGSVSLKKTIAMAKQKKKKHMKAPDTPYYLFTLKGHSELVSSVAVSGDGTTFASASSDRLVQIYTLDKHGESRLDRTVRTNLDGFASLALNEDGRILAGIVGFDNKAALFSLPHGKKVPELKSHFPVEHRETVSRIMLPTPSGSSTPVLITMGGKDTEVKAFSRTGELLGLIKTNQVCNQDVAVSSDGRFIAVAAKTPEIKVWQIEGLADGKKPKKIMTVSGSKQPILSVGFAPDSKTLISLGADGTWRTWDINVRWEVDEDPRPLQSFPAPKGAKRLFVSEDSKRVIIVAVGGVYVYSVKDGSQIDWFSSEGDIIDSCVSRAGDKIILLAAHEKHARVYAVPGSKFAESVVKSRS